MVSDNCEKPSCHAEELSVVRTNKFHYVQVGSGPFKGIEFKIAKKCKTS
jgi:hypothetical protein